MYLCMVVNPSLFGYMQRFGMRWLIFMALESMSWKVVANRAYAVNTISVASGRNVMTFPDISINCEGKSIQEFQ